MSDWLLGCKTCGELCVDGVHMRGVAPSKRVVFACARCVPSSHDFASRCVMYTDLGAESVCDVYVCLIWVGRGLGVGQGV